MAREKMRQSVFEKSADSEKTLVLELPATEKEGEGEKRREKRKEKRKEKREKRKEKREKRKGGLNTNHQQSQTSEQKKLKKNHHHGSLSEQPEPTQKSHW